MVPMMENGHMHNGGDGLRGIGGVVGPRKRGAAGIIGLGSIEDIIKASCLVRDVLA